MTALLEPGLHDLEHDHEMLPPVGHVLNRPQALSAVGRLSAHLTAVERTVYPVAARTLPDGPRGVEEARRWAHAMAVALRRLDRHLTGDWLLARVPLAQLWSEVVQAGREHAKREHALFRDLDRVLDRDTLVALVDNYDAALLRAPSRPHPHAPTHGLGSRLTLRLAAFADRVRDAVDGRPASVRQPSAPTTPPGLWAAYFLGTPQGLGHQQPRRG